MTEQTYIEKLTRRYQIVVYQLPCGRVYRRKVYHRSNRVAWEELIREGTNVEL